MKRLNLYLFIIFFVICLYSCEKVIEIEIPEVKPSLVVNSIFSPDSLLKVQISSSNYIYDSSENYINDAIVELYLEGNLIENLENSGNGFYKSISKPIDLKNYQIKVKHSDYDEVSSESYIPEKVEIKSLKNTFNSYRDMYGDYCHQLEIIFIDPPETENFYEIKLYIDSLKDWFWSHDDTIVYKSEFLYFNTNDIVLNSEIDFSQNNNMVFFSDELINGEEKSIILNYKFSSFPSDEPIDTLFNLFVQFNSTSKEYFEYEESYYNFMNTLSYLYIPEYNYQVISNIENGFGVFAGYNQYSDTLKFR